MKYLFYLFLFILCVFSCSETEVLEINDFYEIFDVQSIVLTVSSESFIEGDEPIRISAVVQGERGRILPNVEVDFLVNGELISTEDFIPPSTGRFNIQARVAELDVVSREIEIISIYGEDITDLELKYNGIPFLTTSPWSTLLDFELTGDVRGLGLMQFSITEVLDRSSLEIISSGEAFSEAGIYNLFTRIGSIESNTVTLTVRPIVEYPVTQIPIIFHFFGVDRLIDDVQDCIDESNAIFSRNHTINSDENPNKVNIPIQLFLATTDPAGNVLDQSGVNIVESGDFDTNPDDFFDVRQSVFWDPNHYLNVYVVSGDFSGGVGFNPAGFATFARVLDFPNDGGFNVVMEEPDVPFFTNITMNGNLSGGVFVHELGHVFNLHHPFSFGCSVHGDFEQDTYAFARESPSDSADNICTDFPLILSNIMDWSGSISILTYDQGERMQRVIEHGLALPTPRNMNKSK